MYPLEHLHLTKYLTSIITNRDDCKINIATANRHYEFPLGLVLTFLCRDPIAESQKFVALIVKLNVLWEIKYSRATRILNKYAYRQKGFVCHFYVVEVGARGKYLFEKNFKSGFDGIIPYLMRGKL